MHVLEVWSRRLLLPVVLASLLVGGGVAAAAEPDEADSAAPAAGEEGEGASEEDAGLTSTERLEHSIRVIQRRPILKDLRFELAITGGVAASDQMYRHFSASATGRFHVSEWVSIGATYTQFFSSESALYREVTGNYELFPERSQIQWYAGADVSVVPIDGKFIAFDDFIVYWDIYASIGGGVTVTSRSDSLKPTGMVGVGFRMFLAKWLTLTFEVRDHIFVEDYNAGSELTNNVVGQAGFSIFVPFGFDYSYPR